MACAWKHGRGGAEIKEQRKRGARAAQGGDGARGGRTPQQRRELLPSFRPFQLTVGTASEATAG